MPKGRPRPARASDPSWTIAPPRGPRNGASSLVDDPLGDLALADLTPLPVPLPDDLVEVPARRGFALRDAIDGSQRHNSTQLGEAVERLNRTESYDRLIVISDEQAHDAGPGPTVQGYMINVATR